MKDIYIYIENGTFLKAKSFGYEGQAVGELVFNTSMTGYQEIVSDPSYAGQFIVFTAPEIGNVGVNLDDEESTGFAKGILVRSYQDLPSNFRSQKSLSQYLKDKKILGLCNVDTRFLTTMLRDEGAMMAIASTEIKDPQLLQEKLQQSARIGEINYVQEVSTKQSYQHTQGSWNYNNMAYDQPSSTNKNIAVIDYGVKRNILNEFVQANLNVQVLSSNIKAKDLIQQFKDRVFDGIFLSNGPGDPMILKSELKELEQLLAEDIPMFGICIGHQMLSIAHGFNTYKMKFGHHGANHPVKNMANGSVEITSQNHIYSVPENITDVAEVTHLNLFDNTIEGVAYKDKKVFSVQFHPEASPGPCESKYLFQKFADLL